MQPETRFRMQWIILSIGQRDERALQAKLDEVLYSKDHQWYLGKMGPKEQANRKKAAEEFMARYAN